MSDSDDDQLDELPEDDAQEEDLFGDGGADDARSDQQDLLSDNELASDRGEDRVDRDGIDVEEHETLIAALPIFRHRIPKSKDGTLQSLRVPDFLKWSPEEYKADQYEPSEQDIAAAKASRLRPVVRFRRDAATGAVESNTLIHRWSDGSITLSVGDEVYEIQNKALAPPSSYRNGDEGGSGNGNGSSAATGPYQELQDAHYYAAAAQLASNTLLVVGHITDQYAVRPNKDVEDVALERLTRRLEAAQHSSASEMIIQTTQDPELQKKQAEMAEKERMRLQRRRETAAARLDGLGASGGGGGGGRYARGALSIGDLEGGRRAAGSARKRGAPGAKRQKRRRPEYDSDDDLPQGARRQDDYDLEDDFIARSDEEISEGEDDDEEELLDEDDDDEEPAPRKKRQKTADAEGEADADAEADLDDVDAPGHASDAHKSRRRNVIQEDDEE